jgi:hypothetical protein
VVTGAGVVTTGPHTASFLNVQNFLQNYLHLNSALVREEMGRDVAWVVGHQQTTHCPVFECAKFPAKFLGFEPSTSALGGGV